jgi:hypothetical protein
MNTDPSLEFGRLCTAHRWIIDELGLENARKAWHQPIPALDNKTLYEYAAQEGTSSVLQHLASTFSFHGTA